MNELLGVNLEHDLNNPATVWDSILVASPEAKFRNIKEFPGNIKIFFALCPLYEKGPLEDSGLIKPPGTIGDSRVSGKWNEICRVLEAINLFQTKKGQRIELTAVFANRGVLLNHEPSQEDEGLLDFHQALYSEELASLCNESGLSYQLLNYDDFGVNLPKFIKPNSQIPSAGIDPSGEVDLASSGVFIGLLNSYLEEKGIPNRITNPNKKTRKIIKDLSSVWGVEMSFWLIAGYMAFDHNIPRLIDENGIYLSTERFDPLFRIANLTDGLSGLPRVEIKA